MVPTDLPDLPKPFRTSENYRNLSFRTPRFIYMCVYIYMYICYQDTNPYYPYYIIPLKGNIRGNLFCRLAYVYTDCINTYYREPAAICPYMCACIHMYAHVYTCTYIYIYVYVAGAPVPPFNQRYGLCPGTSLNSLSSSCTANH
jgi:hypothetical protein